MFERFFPGRADVHRLLLEPIAYANGSALDDPAIAYGIVFSNFMGAGIYTYRGARTDLIGRMTEELRRNGVELRKKVLVERILVEERGGRKVAAGIVAAGGRTIRARAVLSNASLKNTLFRLARRGEPARRTTRPRGGPSGSNASSCQVYLGIRKGESIPHVGDLVFTSVEPAVQQHRADRLQHDEPDVFGLLPGDPSGIGPLCGRRLAQRPLRRLAVALRGRLPAREGPADRGGDRGPGAVHPRGRRQDRLEGGRDPPDDRAVHDPPPRHLVRDQVRGPPGLLRPSREAPGGLPCGLGRDHHVGMARHDQLRGHRRATGSTGTSSASGEPPPLLPNSPEPLGQSRTCFPPSPT